MRPLPAIGIALGAALSAAPALAQTDCSRDSLQAATDSYLAAQAAGDASLADLAADVAYREQDQAAEIGQGTLTRALEIDFHRSLLDVENCQSFTEVIAANAAHPYVLAVTLTAPGGEITVIDSLVTDADDWLFDAANVLEWSPGEDWGPIPEAERDTRETLIAAANAYFDRFGDPGVSVPFGDVCYRLEGGIKTGDGPDAPANSCNLGMPPDGGMALVNRSFVVDPVIGAVAGRVTFGGEAGEPDAHLFRVENGRIRYVHSITVCGGGSCDFGQPQTAP